MHILHNRPSNPLLASKIMQFDAEHGGSPVIDNRGGWYVYEDGASLSMVGDRMDPPDIIESEVRQRRQIHWAKETIIKLAEQFRRQKAAALKTLSDEDQKKLMELHDRIVQIKTNLDALENPPIPKPPHGVRGNPWADGMAELKARREALKRVAAMFRIEAAKAGSDGKKHREVEAEFEGRIASCKRSIAIQKAWLALPFEERARINKELAAAESELGLAEMRKIEQKRREIASISLAFIEEQSFDDMHEAAIKQETADWQEHAETLKERAHKPVVEQLSRDEIAEAEGEAEERRKRPAKKKSATKVRR